VLVEQGPLVGEEVRAAAEHEGPGRRKVDGRLVDGTHQRRDIPQRSDEVVERLAAHGEERVPTEPGGCGGRGVVVVDPLP
jgi:hypothetical protein